VIFPTLKVFPLTPTTIATIFVVVSFDLKAYARHFHKSPAQQHQMPVKEEGKITWRDIPARDVAIDKLDYKDQPTVIKKIVQETVVPAWVPRKSKGYVYYAGDGNGRIKIGFSGNPWSRVKEMRCANPFIEILITEKTDDGYELERKRHEEFKEYHLALEWFRTGERLLDHVNALRIGAGKGSSVSNPPSKIPRVQ